MDTTWNELQIRDIEVEERQMSQEEFERLFSGEHTFPVNRSPSAWSGPDD